jgi:hypothetical protein
VGARRLTEGSCDYHHHIDLQIKYNVDGDDFRSKARFVAKGCSQWAGLDFTETFSYVIIMASMRLFLLISTDMNLDVFQVDIDNTTFLYTLIMKMSTLDSPLVSPAGSQSCVTSSAASTASSSPPMSSALSCGTG